MELLLLIPVFGFLTIYVAYKEWLTVAHKQWLAEHDLFKRRLQAYDQLKLALAPVRAKGAVSENDADRFARAMAEMRFLFDRDLEAFVGALYGTLLKKHELDSLLALAAHRAHSPADKALTETAERKSRELLGRITDGIDRDMPTRMEKFMQPRSVA